MMFVIPDLVALKQEAQLAVSLGMKDMPISIGRLLALIEMAQQVPSLEDDVEALRQEVRDLDRTCDGFEEEADGWRLRYEELQDAARTVVDNIAGLTVGDIK